MKKWALLIVVSMFLILLFGLGFPFLTSDTQRSFVTTLTVERLVSYIMGEQPTITQEDATLLAQSAIQWSKEHDVPIFVTLSVIDVEVNFKPYAVSSQNAHCVMQIVPRIWQKEFDRLNIKGFPTEVRKLHDIDTCIQWGTKILRVLYERHKTWAKAVFNYNPGKGQKYLSDVRNASVKLTWSTM